MSARWSSRAGRPISTKPASSAPQSRQICRSRSTSMRAGRGRGSDWRKRTTLGWSSSLVMVLPSSCSLSARCHRPVGRSGPGTTSVTMPRIGGNGPPTRCIYNKIAVKKRRSRSGRPLLPQPIDGPSEGGSRLAAQHRPGPLLGLPPGGDDRLQEGTALGGEPQRAGSLVARVRPPPASRSASSARRPG